MPKPQNPGECVIFTDETSAIFVKTPKIDGPTASELMNRAFLAARVPVERELAEYLRRVDQRPITQRSNPEADFGAK